MANIAKISVCYIFNAIAALFVTLSGISVYIVYCIIKFLLTLTVPSWEDFTNYKNPIKMYKELFKSYYTKIE